MEETGPHFSGSKAWGAFLSEADPVCASKQEAFFPIAGALRTRASGNIRRCLQKRTQFEKRAVGSSTGLLRTGQAGSSVPADSSPSDSSRRGSSCCYNGYDAFCSRRPLPESQTTQRRPRPRPPKVQVNVLSYIPQDVPSASLFEIFDRVTGYFAGKRAGIRRKGAQSSQAMASIRRPFNSAIGMRSCFMLSRCRRVTVSFCPGPFSPMVSKSTVTPNGVPASSWRR